MGESFLSKLGESVLNSTAIFIEYLIIAFLQVISLTGFCFLLYKSRKNRNLQFSLSMLKYIWCCILQNFLNFFYVVYMAIFWDRDLPTYNSYFVYISGSLGFAALLSVPYSVIFLTLDRILLVLFPMKHDEKRQKIAFAISLATTIAINLFVIICETSVDFPKTGITNCRAQTCMQTTSKTWLYTSTRYIISAINMILAIILGILLKTKLPENNTIQSRANKIIVTTIILTIIFDFGPHFLAFLTMKNELETIRGPHSLFLGTVEVAFGALLYCYFLLKPQKREAAAVTVQNISNFPTNFQPRKSLKLNTAARKIIISTKISPSIPCSPTQLKLEEY